MYFNRGSLPWQGLRAATKRQKYERISEKKMSTPIEELCRGFPAEFATYLNYCRTLRFDEKPDYSYLRQLLRNLFHRQGFTYDYVFDWNLLKFVCCAPYVTDFAFTSCSLCRVANAMRATARPIRSSSPRFKCNHSRAVPARGTTAKSSPPSSDCRRPAGRPRTTRRCVPWPETAHQAHPAAWPRRRRAVGCARVRRRRAAPRLSQVISRCVFPFRFVSRFPPQVSQVVIYCQQLLCACRLVSPRCTPLVHFCLSVGAKYLI